MFLTLVSFSLILHSLVDIFAPSQQNFSRELYLLALYVLTSLAFFNLLWISLLCHCSTETVVLKSKVVFSLYFVRPFGKQGTINHSLILEKCCLCGFQDNILCFPSHLLLTWVFLHWLLLCPALGWSSSSGLCSGPPFVTSHLSLCGEVIYYMHSKTSFSLIMFTFLFPIFTPNVNIWLLPDISILCIMDISD